MGPHSILLAASQDWLGQTAAKVEARMLSRASEMNRTGKDGDGGVV